MKHLLTLLLLGTSLGSFAQRTPGDTQADFERDPVVMESAKVITVVRSQMQARAQQSKLNSTTSMTEAEYQLLTTRAEELMLQQNFNEAEVVYSEILSHRTDQFSSDRIAEIQALKAAQQKKFEQAKKDAELRAKAENAGSVYNRKLVHFSGGLIYDEFQNHGFSKAFHEDRFSEIIGLGKYSSIAQIVPKASRHTFDGIAIPAGVRLVIYKNQNFSGDTLLDITGPAIVNNSLWTFEFKYKEANSKEFIPEIQAYYPQAVRIWSTTNMHEWNRGSMEIMLANE